MGSDLEGDEQEMVWKQQKSIQVNDCPIPPSKYHKFVALATKKNNSFVGVCAEHLRLKVGKATLKGYIEFKNILFCRIRPC